MIYIDPTTLRRSVTVAGPTATNQDSPVTMATTASQLARAFGIVLRQVTDLLNMMPYCHALTPSLPMVLEVTPQEEHKLQVKTSANVRAWPQIGSDWLIQPKYTEI